MALISVIVPVYRVEAYLCRCVDSILRQTHRELELILVDDGSPDACPSMCDDYAQKDKRVRVVHQQNGGLSDARNAGLRIAAGAYIAFVDSDDWVAEDYLETMLDAMCQTGSEICECGVEKVCDEQIPQAHGGRASAAVYDAAEALRQLILDREFKQHVWNKLYRRDCLADIPFAVGRTHEDEFWTYQVFGRAKRIAKVSCALYYYFQRPGSIMGSGFSIRRLDALEAKMMRQAYIENRYPALAETARINVYHTCMHAGQMTLRYLHGEERKEAIRRIDVYRKAADLGSIKVKSFAGSARIWAAMVKLTFWGACSVKNLLNKGF